MSSPRGPHSWVIDHSAAEPLHARLSGILASLSTKVAIHTTPSVSQGKSQRVRGNAFTPLWSFKFLQLLGLRRSRLVPAGDSVRIQASDAACKKGKQCKRCRSRSHLRTADAFGTEAQGGWDAQQTALLCGLRARPPLDLAAGHQTGQNPAVSLVSGNSGR